MLPHRKPVPQRSVDLIDAIRGLPRVDDISQLDKEKERLTRQDEVDPLSLPQPDMDGQKGDPQVPMGALPRVEEVPAKQQLPNPAAAAAKPEMNVSERAAPGDPPRPAYRSLLPPLQPAVYPSDPWRRMAPAERPRVRTPPADFYSNYGNGATRTHPATYMPRAPSETPRPRERVPRVGHCWAVYNILTIGISLMILVGCFSTHTQYFPLAVIPDSSSMLSNTTHARYMWGYSGHCYVLDKDQGVSHSVCAHKFVQQLTPPPSAVFSSPVASEGEDFYGTLYSEVEHRNAERHGYRSPKIRQRIFKASAAMLIVALIVLIYGAFFSCLGPDEALGGCLMTAAGTLYLVPYFIMVHLAVASFIFEVYGAHMQNSSHWGKLGSHGEFFSWGLVMVDINIILTFMFWAVYACRFVCY